MNKLFKALVVLSSLFMISCDEDSVADNIEISITKPSINRQSFDLPSGDTIEGPSINIRFSAINNNVGKIISIEEITGIATNLETKVSIPFDLGPNDESFLLQFGDGTSQEIPYTYFAVLAPTESTSNSAHFDQARIKPDEACASPADGDCVFQFNELYIQSLPGTIDPNSLVIPRYRIDVTFRGTVGDDDGLTDRVQSKENALVNPTRRFNKTINIYTEILD